MKKMNPGPTGRGNMPKLIPTTLKIEAELSGTLVRRYKRFLADIELEDGSELTVHCPNPGRMTGTKAPGSAVRCSTHDSPKRKLRHTLEMIRVDGSWVGLHAAKANAIAKRVLEANAYEPFADYEVVESEVSVPEGSRFDFRLSGHPIRDEPFWIEVKSVTLCESRRAMFPDAVTTRGRRHLEHLIARRRLGERAALLYIVQREDADSVEPADDVDPEYGAALRKAAAANVEIHALGARISTDQILLDRVLPVLL
jgi:sugar fermentation stimulation protein A